MKTTVPLNTTFDSTELRNSTKMSHVQEIFRDGEFIPLNWLIITLTMYTEIKGHMQQHK